MGRTINISLDQIKSLEMAKGFFNSLCEFCETHQDYHRIQSDIDAILQKAKKAPEPASTGHIRKPGDRRKGWKPSPLTEEDIAFIKQHHQDKTVLEIAHHLRRGDSTIYQYMKRNGMKGARNPAKKLRAEKESEFFEVMQKAGEFSWIV